MVKQSAKVKKSVQNKKSKKLFLRKKRRVTKQKKDKKVKSKQKLNMSKKYQKRKLKMKGGKIGKLYPYSELLGNTSHIKQIAPLQGKGATNGIAYPENHYVYQSGNTNAIFGSEYANVNTSLGGKPPKPFKGYKQSGGSGMLTNLVRQGGYELKGAYDTLLGKQNKMQNPDVLDQPINKKEVHIKPVTDISSIMKDSAMKASKA